MDYTPNIDASPELKRRMKTELSTLVDNMTI